MTPGNIAEILRREWRASIDRLQNLPDEGWAEATRCEGWTVADLAAHMAWGAGFEADGLRRARTGCGGVAQAPEVEPDPERLAGAVVEAASRLWMEAEQAGTARVPMPYGELDPGVASAVFVMEAAVHGSDLAAALGEDDRLADDVVTAIATVVSAFLPVTAAGAPPPPPGTSYRLVGDSVDLGFADSGEGWVAQTVERPSVTISGSDSDVLLFALGRCPLDRLTVRGPRPVAESFKTHLPGL